MMSSENGTRTRPSRPRDIEHQALRQLVDIGDVPMTSPDESSTRHPHELVQIDLVFSERGELARPAPAGSVQPQFRLVAVGDPAKATSNPSLKGRVSTTVSAAVSSPAGPVDGARENTTAGREHRVRRVGERLDHDFAANAVGPANAPDDDQIFVRRHAAVSREGRPSRRPGLPPIAACARVAPRGAA